MFVALILTKHELENKFAEVTHIEDSVEIAESSFSSRKFKDVLADIGNVKVYKLNKNYDDKEFSCLRKAIFFEVRKANKEEMTAVANVIFNRAEYKHYPSTICKVVLEKGQFEYVMRGLHSQKAVEQTVSKNIIEKKSWELATEVALQFMTERPKDNTKGAIAYHANSMEKPNSDFWKKLSLSKKLGLHTYYTL